MIVADAIGKRFGARAALTDATFQVGRGEIVGFLGPNGAGKTTALRILAGVFPPTSGRARIDGFDVATRSIDARRRTGYLPERPALYPELTVHAMLAFVARVRGLALGGVADAVARTRLGPLLDRRIRTLSKGMRQRVGLAVALVGDPPVLLLDEPTAGLDPGERTATRTLIRSLAPGRAVLLSSHELIDVQSCCDRVVILHGGRVRAEGPPGELATRLHALPRVRVTARAPSAALATTLATVAGVGRVLSREDTADGAVVDVEPAGTGDVRAALAAAVHEAGWELLGLGRIEPSLEEVFLHLVQPAEDGRP